MSKTAIRKIRVLLADDHLVVRMGLAAIIGLERNMSVVGEASNGEEAVRLAQKLRPDVVMMDLMMPKLSGADATERIARECPEVKVLVLTTFSSSSAVRRALAGGAAGALVKDISHAEMIDAIRRTANGERVVSPEITAAMSVEEVPLSLSPRHREILELVAKGFNNREIARTIGIGLDGVKSHLKTIFARLGVASRSEAVAVALREKMI